ncbi:rRNA maturation RNase YbeY [Thermotoga sp. KOL6]|uniref:rRNA maturation RNase YbeY n=1 Tax=Thermotoga sp. KOL6 TaxID=126741 RepID=UPI000C786BFB|nr:rRNA maturation RNase YbeY [Thermotoga sp. KOL6]PLV60239.1 rRNA maturation RNase YbeY [Thermotoga sp. KOL6]
MIKILGEGKELLERVKEKLEEIAKEEIGEVNVNVVFVNKNEIRKMNKEFRNQDYPTDVLTFPLFDEDVYGEIYVCLDVVKENAIEYNVPFERELIEVVVHGLLHLAGYDHEFEDKNSKEMFEKQKKYTEEVWKEWKSNPSEDSGRGKM